jgi:hypothetical protein
MQKISSQLERAVQNCTTAHVCDSTATNSSVVFTSAFQLIVNAWAKH